MSDQRGSRGGVPVEMQFVAFVRQEVPGAADRTDDELIAGGRDLCARLDSGMTVDEMAVSADMLGFDIEELGAVLAGAVNTLCPRHRDIIP